MSTIRIAKPTEKETYSGRLIDLVSPTLDDIDLGDIIRSLSQTFRYGGHSLEYNNAQHSLLVGALMPREHRIHGLVHDFPESYLGDDATPKKRALELLIPGYRNVIKALEAPFEELIYRKLGVALPSPDVRALVKIADQVAMATEQRDIMRSPNQWNIGYRPAAFTIRPVGTITAAYDLADAIEEETGIEIALPHKMPG